MKAVRFNRYGDIEVLHVVDVPVPQPAQGQVLRARCFYTETYPEFLR
jgi:NADPH:quinone reductase-like Zn-dependent oxidoreductase